MAYPQPPLIKFDVCMYKQDGITFEEFAKYVTEIYPPKAIPVMKKHGIVQWSTTVYPPEQREQQREAAKQMGRDNWTIPDYDVAMSYWIRSMDDLGAMVMSPEWNELEAESLPKVRIEIGHFLVGQQIVHFGIEEANGKGA